MNSDVRQRIGSSVRQWAENGAHHLEFGAMAGRCRVTVAASDTVARAFQREALDWVARFESRYSRFLPDSLVSKINGQAGRRWVEVDEETDRLLSLCHEAHFISRGVFDPTALPLLQLWNWKANPPVIPTEEAVAAARDKVGWRKVQRAPGKVFLPEPGMSLDLGGLGKEYAVDSVAALAVGRGIQSVLVDFGQDVLALGLPPDGRPAWHIGLEDPRQPGRCWAGVAVQNMAVATSGDYLRRFELNGRTYGHIIDVRTGRPVANGHRAVSVLAPGCTLAGILSTAAFVLGPEEGLRLLDSMPGVAGCMVTDHQTIQNRRFHEYLAA
jgi:FAD:protein FMN transferase